MTKDDTVVAEPTEPQEPVEPQEPTEPQEPQEPQEDYRGKLNATNNFLKKEGYVFDEAAKQWKKPASAPRPTEPSSEPETDRKDGQALSALEQRIVKAELSAIGVKHPEDQAYVIEAGKRLNVDPTEAASDEIVAAKLERMRAARDAKDATPSPRRGTGTSQKTGKMPDFSKMSDAEFDKWERENRN